MKLKIQYGNGVCTLPLRALSEKGAERTDLLALMHLSVDPSLSDNIPSLAKKIGCTQKKAESAVEFWLECGILALCDPTEAETEIAAVPSSSDAAVPKSVSRFETRPKYDSSELAEIIERDEGSVRQLIDECARILGRIFTPTETAKIVGLVDYLGIDFEHILAIFTYCARRGKRSVSYIEKTAYNLFDEGVDSAEKLEDYIKRKEEKESREAELRRLIDAGGRSLTEKERTALYKWQSLKISDELIRHAYENTVESTGKYSFAYMSKIIERWHEAGITTVEAADAEEEKFREEKKKTASKKGSADTFSGSSFNNDEFVEMALRRSYGASYKSADGE